MKKPVEYQAVVIVNQSRNLHPITEDIPEALLPVSNKPMIFHVLNWLENAGIQEIMVLVSSSLTATGSSGGAVGGGGGSTSGLGSTSLSNINNSAANVLSSSPKSVAGISLANSPNASASNSGNPIAAINVSTGTGNNNSSGGSAGASSGTGSGKIILKQTSFRNYDGKAKVDLIIVDDKDNSLDSAQLLSHIKDRIYVSRM